MDSNTHISHRDLRALLTMPDSERIGALMRLNRSMYQNKLDAIRIYFILRDRMQRFEKTKTTAP